MRVVLAAGVSAAALLCAAGVAHAQSSNDTVVEEIIVTAQKKEEAIQDVPIAISAFTQEGLEAQKIEGGGDLVKAVPNVSFSKNNFSSYNFQIRGIGTKALAVSTDPAVAVSFNNSALLRNRLFEQEYFDVERVEVLRGPQGTLYGRNATGGVINMITARPTDRFEGQVEVEVGNFDSRRMKAMVNIPLGDTLAVRIAGAATDRSGYGYNATTGNDVDGRSLWSGRATLAWKPTDRFNANLIWEHFDEDDNRARSSKQLCHHDAGPSSVGGIDISTSMVERGLLSQGCLPGSLYSADAYGTPNGASIPFVTAAQTLTSLGGDSMGNYIPAMKLIDPYGGRMQSRDLRQIESKFDPVYRARADIYQLNMDFELTPSLQVFSQTIYNTDDYYASQDYNRFTSDPIFVDSSTLQSIFGFGPVNITPGGIYTDPQLGPSDTIMGLDISKARSKQFSQELRIQSDFDGPVNFSAGANYLKYETNEDYYVFFNAISLVAEGFFNALFTNGQGTACAAGETTGCVYVDPNPVNQIDGNGHNYYRSQNPYDLTSKAAFGEVYWEASDTLKVTAGLRYTQDHKAFTLIPTQLLMSPNLGGGYINSGSRVTGRIDQEWSEFTGRLGVDWKPDLSFTDETMVYAFYSRGYKGGGANPPGIDANPALLQFAALPSTYRPEFVDAFEVGTKNTLLGGSLVLNGAAFYYDYSDYQISKIVDRMAVNENFDATIWGAELEAIWQPTGDLRLNASVGYLSTKLGDGSKSIDLMDRLQGHDDYMVVKPWNQLTSNCVVPKTIVTQLMSSPFYAGQSGFPLMMLCGGGLLGDLRPGGSWASLYGVSFDPATQSPNNGAGFMADVSGNDLPNAPHWTFSVGAQYTMHLGGGWEAVLRGDYYRQGDSYARIYNTAFDRLEGWQNGNLSLTVTQPDNGLQLQLYVKNIFDESPITDAFLNSDDSALTTNVFTLDPRLVGLSIRKTF
jgi:outer membrane receptor protein involved in Fe transport